MHDGIGHMTPPGWYIPQGAVHAGRYGQQAGGTHPTGMHSCLSKNSLFIQVLIDFGVHLKFRLPPKKKRLTSPDELQRV